MQLPMRASLRRRWIVIALAVCAAALAFIHPLRQVTGLILGGAVLAFLIAPAAAFYEKRFSRPVSALLAIGTILIAAALLMGLLLPSLLRELAALAEALPRSVGRLSGWLIGASTWLQARLPGVELPRPRLDGLMNALPGLFSGTVAVADGFSRFSMMLMLCFFFLCDRDNLLLRMELMVPLRWRSHAVRAGRALSRELRLYLKGQLSVALGVGMLATAGLWLIGLRSALALGCIVGLLNMIPYFGPLIGGVPAMLIALGDGWMRAVLCLGVLTLVQQIDSAVLSPRIMSGLTGFSPAMVLLAIYAGATLGGVAGMLAALPLLMSIRTVFRVFITNRENI